MTIKILKYSFFALVLSLAACQSKTTDETTTNASHDHAEAHPDEVILTPQQEEAVGIKIGQIENYNLSDNIRVTGQLEVPPQGKASVSHLMGGNVQQIMVTEGAYVKKGQTLAVLVHPDLIRIQQDYQEQSSQIDYLQAEYNRKKTLAEKQVAPEKDYQKAKAEYLSASARLNGLKKQLQLLGINPASVLKGNYVSSLPVRSPINGFVNAVSVNTGAFVSPQESLFEITDNNHVHADFRIFENDIPKVRVGQIIDFTVANLPGKILQAKIFTVGNNFENDTRTVHIHADVLTKDVKLLPGMFVDGRIQLDSSTVPSLPESAVVADGEKQFIFILKNSQEHGRNVFVKTEIGTGRVDQGRVEIKFFKPIPEKAQVVTHGAYYLLADMTKEENKHEH